MDGVLVDNHHYHLIAWKKFCEIKSIPFNEDEFRAKYFGKNNQEILTGLLKRKVDIEETLQLGEEKEELYREL